MLDDETIAQLFETLIWQATDGDDVGTPLDSLGYDRSDIPRTDQERLLSEFRSFVDTNADALNAFMTHTDRSWSDVAHDYILTRNEHGAGFWDRCYCGNDDAAQTLTDAAHADGNVDLMRGDDGALFIA